MLGCTGENPYGKKEKVSREATYEFKHKNLPFIT
jgi:hypothetical protein